MSNHLNAQDQLRKAAEAKRAHAPKVEPRPAKELLHELQVHQIELEMQNEALRQSQSSLEEARDRLVDFYDFSPVGYITLSSEALITEINLTGAALLGEERGKLQSRHFASIVAPEDGDRWHLHFMAVLRHDSKQSCELKLLRKNGLPLHVRLDSLRLLKDSGVPEVRIVMIDITERKLADAALRESEGRRRELEQLELVQTSLDGFFVASAKDARLIKANDVFCNLLGYTLEELLSMRIPDLEAIETPEETAARMKKIMEVGYDRFETCQRHKQGHEISIEASVSYSASNDGVFFAFVRDITERKRMDEMLKKSRDQLMTFIHQSPVIIAMFDRDMNYLAVSDLWIATYGRGYTDLIGRNHYEIHPDIPPAWKLVHQQALAGATLNKNEDMWLMGDGSKHWLRWAVLPWTDQNNAIGGIIILADDITAQKNMETEIMERRLDQQSEMDYLQKLQVRAFTNLAGVND